MIKRYKKGAIVLALLVVVLIVVPGCSSHASVDEWTEVYTYWEGLHAVWGSSSSDVFAVGTNGAIVHYNGSTWSPMSITTSHDLFGVWGSSASDVFAVWSGGTILHYDGSAWSVMKSGTKWCCKIFGAVRRLMSMLWGITPSGLSRMDRFTEPNYAL